MDFNFSLGGFGGDGELLDFDPSHFALGGKTDNVESCRYLQPKVYENVVSQPVVFGKCKEFVASLPQDLSDAHVFAFVSGNFIFGDVLEALVASKRLQPRRITVQTLTMSENNIDSLYNVIRLSPHLEHLRVIVSAFWWAKNHRKGQLVDYLYETLDVDDKLDVAFAALHSKIITVEDVRGFHLVIDGSANLCSSRNIEQFRIEADDGLYQFIDQFCDRVMDAYATINHDVAKPQPIRAGALFDHLRKDGVVDG